MAYKGFSQIREQMEKNKTSQSEEIADNDVERREDESEAVPEQKKARKKTETGNDKRTVKTNFVDNSESQDENANEQSAAISGSVRKTITIPLEMDLAIRELKEQRKLKRKFSNQKGKDTDDDIFFEALKVLFAQNGEFADSLENVRVKLQKLSS